MVTAMVLLALPPLRETVQVVLEGAVTLANKAYDAKALRCMIA